MSMVISNNISALNTMNQLNRSSNSMNSALEKLSSGYAINSASDDAAGLSISEKMRAQIEGLNQASDNSQDAISLAQTADGALDETNSILKRMRELAVKASSETLTDDDRTAVQDEVDQLRQEIDRISNDTEFNTKKLLNGNSGTSTSVSGTNSAAIVATETKAGNSTTSGTYEVKYNSVATQATSGLSTSTTGISSSEDSADAFAGDVSINGTTITISEGDTIEGVLEKINAETDTTGITAKLDQSTTGNYFIKLTSEDYGSDASITIKADNNTLSGLFNAVSDTTSTSVTFTGTDATGTINGAIATAKGNTLTAFDLTVTGDDEALNKLTDTYAKDTLTAALTANGSTDATSAKTALTANAAANEALATALESAKTDSNSVAAEKALKAAVATATAASGSDTAVTTAKKSSVINAYSDYTSALESGDAESIVNAKANLTTAVGVLADGVLSAQLNSYNTSVGTAINTAATNAVTTAGTLKNAIATVGDPTIPTDATATDDDLAELDTAITDVTNTAALGTLTTSLTTAAGTTGDTSVLEALNAYKTALNSRDVDAIVSTYDDLATAATAYDTAHGGTVAATALTTYDGAGTVADIDTVANNVKTKVDTALGVSNSINNAYKSYNTAVDATASGDVATASVEVDASSNLTFQVGANSKQTMTLSIDDMDASALGVAGTSTTTGIDLSSADKATDAITTIDSAIAKVAAARSNLGAVQNSLESNINMLDTESENLTSAESNIRDTDMAEEMSNYTRLSVINQAATTMLAKANSQPQQVMTLLQG